jgi:hypothetical protein
MSSLLANIGFRLAEILSKPRHIHSASPPTPPERLRSCLQPGDILLVEGSSQISTAIKYLTQSTWSHASLYVGFSDDSRVRDPTHCFVEADVVAGVRTVGLAEYEGLNTRICRPVGLSSADVASLIAFAFSQLGHRYDLRNVIDLARYLLPVPPVPTRFRRRMIALGSGDPTRAICSTFVSQAFQSIGYPALPTIEYRSAPTAECPGCTDEILHIRHHSLYTPRDFDVSPYFAIIKPTIEDGFDFRVLNWAGDAGDDTPFKRAAHPRQQLRTNIPPARRDRRDAGDHQPSR